MSRAKYYTKTLTMSIVNDLSLTLWLWVWVIND